MENKPTTPTGNLVFNEFSQFLIFEEKGKCYITVFENLEKWLSGLVRARIVVDGVVQGVGYRALVRQIARQLGLKGLVRNLEDTKVEIFCEGVKNKIEEFLKKIDRKAKPEDFLSINVSEIKCFFEGDPNYKPAWKPYKGFEIDYGVEKLSALDEATLEDHEFGKLYFIGFRDEMKGFRQDTNVSFKELAEKYENTSKEMKAFGDELKGFREDTNKNFKDMAEKYGDISKELKEFRKTVKEFLEAFLSEYQKRTTN